MKTITRAVIAFWNDIMTDMKVTVDEGTKCVETYLGNPNPEVAAWYWSQGQMYTDKFML